MTGLAAPVASTGRRALEVVQDSGRLGLFLLIGLARIFAPPYKLRSTLVQLRFIGARSTLVVVVSGTFVGMVVALQFYDTLVRFGSVSLLGSAVGLSLIRELGPVITGLMVIGRAGSAMCSEIGIMRSQDQIDALECMAIDPHHFLIAPRLVAGVVSMPLLVAIFVLAGVCGGWFVGVVLFGVSEGAYFQGMYDTVTWRDLAMGFSKALAFGLLFTWLCCGKGFLLHLDRKGAFGAEGVSRVTTEAVVLSSIALLFSDYLISAFLV